MIKKFRKIFNPFTGTGINGRDGLKWEMTNDEEWGMRNLSIKLSFKWTTEYHESELKCISIDGSAVKIYNWLHSIDNRYENLLCSGANGPIGWMDLERKVENWMESSEFPFSWIS